MLAFGEEARYRLRLADGFLRGAGEDLNLCRWRSCVDNSQLAAENAAKVVLALLGPELIYPLLFSVALFRKIASLIMSHYLLSG
jgi:HEPN domain-containing protein